MHVIGTAGHVDHGKSTLVRALTGMDPDRLAEERRRGLTIDLGYAWTTLPDLGDVAIVDVPGHERFVRNMLTGLAPLSAVLFVVAADQGWQRQSVEHLAAIDALGIRHGVLVVTRSDLADPSATLAVAEAELAQTSLAGAPVVAVSGATGAGLEELRGVLASVLRGMATAPAGARARLWIDRAFTVRGAGTVVTGTLTDGSVNVGDELALGGPGAGRAGRPGVPGEARARVRGVESLGVTRSSVSAVARVALNLRGIQVDSVRRGMAAGTPAAWSWAETCDVRLSGDPRGYPGNPTLHIGTAALPVRLRPLGRRSARLLLTAPLPLTPGDHGLLRSPDSEGRVLGLVVQDVDPEPLRRRGSAAAVGARLDERGELPDLVTETERRGALQITSLRRLGIPMPAGDDRPGPVEFLPTSEVTGSSTDAPAVVRAGDWLVGVQALADWRDRLVTLLAERARSRPLDPYVTHSAAAVALDLPGPDLIALVADVPELLAEERGLRLAQAPPSLGDHEPALLALERRLRSSPLDAPTADELAATGLTPSDLATAVRLRRLVRLGRAGAAAVYVAPDAPQGAVEVLAAIPQPFTAASAREALATTRRVAIPLLEYLDALGLTRRVDATARAVARPVSPPVARPVSPPAG